MMLVVRLVMLVVRLLVVNVLDLEFLYFIFAIFLHGIGVVVNCLRTQQRCAPATSSASYLLQIVES